MAIDTTGGAPARADPPAEVGEYLLSAESDERPTLSIVLPTLDEEAGIADCIAAIKTALSELETTAEIIVSDSSTDRTPEIARDLGAIVVEPDESGYGYAYRYAFERARGEYIVMGDADTTYDFAELPKLVRHLEASGADIVLGSRLEGEIKPGAMPPLHQYVGNPLLTRFLNTFYDAGVSDAHSGFRVFTRDALETLDLSTNGMEFASEMIMDAGAKDLVIEEVPITYHERAGDATLDSFQDGWRHVKFMLMNAPGYLFTIPGVVMAGVGVLVMGLCLGGVSFGRTSFGAHSMIAGSLATIVGTQVTALGAFASIAGDPIRRPEDPITEVLVTRVRLENGATIGLVALGVGGGYLAVVYWRWLASGFTELPTLMGDIAAFTAIVLGVQILFSSFFLSALQNT